MYTVIVSLILFCSVLLILVILAQNSKGGGLTSQFGGSGASNMIGVKKTSDLLERITWGLAITVMALSLVANINLSKSSNEGFDGLIQEEQGPALPQLPSSDGATEGLEQLELGSDSTSN